MDAGEDMNSVTGAVHKGQDSGTAPINTAGVTRTRPPGPLGQFQTCLVKPLARFLTIPYLHAQRILQLSRTVHVFHMQSTYIARQAIHLVILLNDVVDEHEGPDEEQYQERIDLGDELIELFDAMQEWGATSDEGLEVDYAQGLLKLNQQYAQFFRERFYFHNVRNSADDLIYSKLVAYDRKTIDFRKCQYLHTTGVDLNGSTTRAESEGGHGSGAYIESAGSSLESNEIGVPTIREMLLRPTDESSGNDQPPPHLLPIRSFLHLSTSNDSFPSPSLPPPLRPHLRTSNWFFPSAPHQFTYLLPDPARHSHQGSGQDGGDSLNESDEDIGIASGQRKTALWRKVGDGQQPGDTQGVGSIHEWNVHGDIAPGESAVQGEEFAGIKIEQLMERRNPNDLSDQIDIDFPRTPHSGGYGRVYAGSFGRQKVAVKNFESRTIEIHAEQANERRVGREIRIWAALRHPNICGFLGYTTSFRDYPAIVSPWPDGQKLSQYLESQELSFNDRVGLANDVSNGLQYIHNLKVIDGDIKPGNILVDEHGIVKLCDFRLAPLLYWQGSAGVATETANLGSTPYKTRELFPSAENRLPVVTFENDIYSLGCIMLKFIECLHPFEIPRSPCEGEVAIEGRLSPALFSEATQPLGPYITGPLWELLEACWDMPTRRPNIHQIVESLMVDTMSQNSHFHGPLSRNPRESSRVSGITGEFRGLGQINNYGGTAQTNSSGLEALEDTESVAASFQEIAERGQQDAQEGCYIQKFSSDGFHSGTIFDLSHKYPQSGVSPEVFESGTESKHAGNSKLDGKSFSGSMKWVADVPPPYSRPVGAASSSFYSDDGYLPSALVNPPDGNEIDEEEENSLSPPNYFDDSNASGLPLEIASKIALRIAPDTPKLRSVIQDLLRGDRRLEIPHKICTDFNATPDGPNYTCSLFEENERRCMRSFTRLDRFRHHLQSHLGITPYRCMDFPKHTDAPKCGRLFSSVAARDTHVRAKGGPVTRDCGTSVLRKNFARHRMTCRICSSHNPPI